MFSCNYATINYIVLMRYNKEIVTVFTAAFVLWERERHSGLVTLDVRFSM